MMMTMMSQVVEEMEGSPAVVKACEERCHHRCNQLMEQVVHERNQNCHELKMIVVDSSVIPMVARLVQFCHYCLSSWIMVCVLSILLTKAMVMQQQTVFDLVANRVLISCPPELFHHSAFVVSLHAFVDL
jgi:hypothetical protein